MKLQCTQQEFESNLSDSIATCDSSDLIGSNTLFFCVKKDGTVYHFCETNNTDPAGHVVKSVQQHSVCDWGGSDADELEAQMNETPSDFTGFDFDGEDLRFSDDDPTMREFIAENDLNPEDGGLGLDFFEPDTAILQESLENEDGSQLHIFSDGSVRCGLLDTDTTSVLMSEDELTEYEQSQA